MPVLSKWQRVVLAASVLLLLKPASVWAWGDHGHKIVAVIAADNLTPVAASHVAQILGVQHNRRAIAAAMEDASVLPDTEFRDEDKRTGEWHFIDICLRDRRTDLLSECPTGNCVTVRIDDYSRRLKDGSYDRWGAAGDLAFLIHFVGDIHQPLHAATDSDKGGNCIAVDSYTRAKNLHDAWDNAIVRRLEDNVDSGRPETTAHKLERMYDSEKASDTWTSSADVAWESHQLAISEVYDPLHIPKEPCEPRDALCRNPEMRVELDSTYINHAADVAGHQLAKAGFRLASLLNQTWTQPAADSGNRPTTQTANADPDGQIVGNRRSKIYAWPGCASYDTMAPENRVVFASRQAAEQAGYRAARNCF